jgi:TRAP transporter TAXI family solute receptor
MKMKSLIIALAITTLLASAAAAQTLGIGTSNPGSITHSTGSAIAKLITEQTGMQARVQPHSGNSAFVPAVNAGEVDFGAANVLEMQYALTGTGIYKGQVLKDLQVVTVLMPLRTAFFVKKDSPIKTVKDLMGKRVPGKWTAQKVINYITNGLLANAGMSYKDVKMVPVPNVNRSADDFIQGKADTFFFAVGSGKVREAGAKVGGLRALAVDPSPEAMARFREHMPVIYPLLLEPTKPNYGIVEPTYVAAFDLLFVTNNKVPENVIYKVTKAIYGGKKALFASFKTLGANFSPQKMAKVLPAGEYHPGAIKFYKEVGMWPPKEGVVAK